MQRQSWRGGDRFGDVERWGQSSGEKIQDPPWQPHLCFCDLPLPSPPQERGFAGILGMLSIPGTVWGCFPWEGQGRWAACGGSALVARGCQHTAGGGVGTRVSPPASTWSLQLELREGKGGGKGGTKNPVPTVPRRDRGRAGVPGGCGGSTKLRCPKGGRVPGKALMAAAQQGGGVPQALSGNLWGQGSN